MTPTQPSALPSPDRSRLPKAFAPRASSLRGLRNRLLLWLVIVALLPLAVLAIYLRHQFTASVESSAQAMVITVARNHEQTIEGALQRKITLLQHLARSELITMPPSREQLEHLLVVLQALDGMILDISVFDAKGTHLCYAGPFEGLEGQAYADQEWFQALAEGQDAYVSDVFRGHRDAPHFVVAVRAEVAGQDWFLRLTVNPERFAELVGGVTTLAGADAFIVSADGRYQAVPASVGSPLGQVEPWPPLSAGAAAGEAVFDGRHYLVALVNVPTTRWTLVVRQDVAVAHGAVTRTRLGALTIMAVGLVLILMASVYATRSLVRRYDRVESDRHHLVEQLVQAGKLGTLGEMAAGVAHEINNPLAVIASEVGVMEDVIDPSLGGGTLSTERLREHLRAIHEEVMRCRDITHKLLGFARAHETEIGPCSLGQLATEAVHILDKQLLLDNIEVVFERDERLGPISSDAEKLRQVVLNLVRNAADALGSNGRIVIRTFRDGDWAVVSVSDDGPGIAPEHLDRIFEPFFTTKQVGHGTGLGLSISHGIVVSLGGEIAVTSEPGRGATFEVRLPRRSRA